MVLLLQSSQVLCQWRGHTSRDKLQVILGFPPINCSTRWPLVLQTPGGYRLDRMALQVSFLSSSESFECSSGTRDEPSENKQKLPSAFSSSRWASNCCGILGLHMLICLSSVSVADCESTIAPSFSDVCAAAAATKHKDFQSARKKLLASNILTPG